MTGRELFRHILHGGIPGRVAWFPRLAIWHTAHMNDGTLPPELQGRNLQEAEKHLGMGRAARDARVFRIEYDGVRVTEEPREDLFIVRYSAPEGTLEGIYKQSKENARKGISRILHRPFLKSEEDYRLLAKIMERRRYIPAYDEYLQYDRACGEDGLPMVGLGECPFHDIMLNWAGYEQFFFHFYDFPETVLDTVRVMEDKARTMWEVVADSPAEFLLHGTHFNPQVMPPPMFRERFVPYLSEFVGMMHRAQKKVAFHADADLSGLLEDCLTPGFDVADTFACAPLVPTTFDQAREAWGDRIVIWGGVPSIILEPQFPRHKFEAYMHTLLEKTADKPAFIMAVSDNIMPAAEFDRLVWIRDVIRETL